MATAGADADRAAEVERPRASNVALVAATTKATLLAIEKYRAEWAMDSSDRIDAIESLIAEPDRAIAGAAS